MRIIFPLVLCLILESCSQSTEPTCMSSEEEKHACSIDNGTHGTPDTKNRVCTISPPGPYHILNSYWRTLNCDNSNAYDPVCPGFVGMNLTYTCDIPEAQLYRDGVYVNGSSVNHGYLLPEHAGVYECRNSSDANIISVQNLTVNEDVRIGGAVGRCSSFYANCSNKCCTGSSVWFVCNVGELYPLSVYGENVTVVVELVEWLVDRDTRSEVDLGLSVQQNMTDLVTWNIMVGNHPLTITNETPSILFRVTASNAFSSHSVCISAKFSAGKDVVSVEDDTLPQSTEAAEGQDAMFQCKFSLSLSGEGRNDLFCFDFNFVKHALIGNETKSISSKTSYYYESNRFFPDCADCPFSVNLRNQSGNQQSAVLWFDIVVPQVTKDLNGSTFSCSIVFQNDETSLLQWKRIATLSVFETVDNPAGSGKANIKFVSVVSLLVVVLLVAVITTTIIVTVRRRKYRQRSTQVKPDEVPLRCSSVHSSRSTLCGSEANTPVVQHGRVPCIEILDARGSQPGGMLVREQFPGGSVETHSSDSRVNSSLEGFFAESQLTGNRHSPPTSLQLSYIPHTKIDTSENYYDTSQLSKFIVYISYTDRKATWVRNKLKPLIESLHTKIEVNLHESSMIPGFAVSSERHRLILEADKIIIVVSNDYSTSPWCLFELEHAIHQKPALCNGRVIPILTDNCYSVPSIISGVVYLSDQETDFTGRLRQAIFKKPLSFYNT